MKTKMINTVLLCCVVASVLLVKSSEAILCYYCNSANNSACIDVREYEEYNLIPVVECETSIPSNIAVNFFCRKIVQTILHPGRDSELRVTRGCGWIQHHRECYKADNEDHLETVCQCFSDQCNSSSRPIQSAILFTIAAILAVKQVL